MAYLCSGIFDEDISDEQIQDSILSGKYRLLWFTMSQWIVLSRHCIETSNNLIADPQVLELLTRVALELRNYHFQGQISLKDSHFQSLESEWPEIYQMICGVLEFQRDDRHTDWNVTNSMPYNAVSYSSIATTANFILQAKSG